MKTGILASLTCMLFSGLAPVLAQENGLLWKIEGQGLEQASYLYGTIHLIPTEYFVVDSAVMTALEEADKAIFEIDLAVASDPAQMSMLLQLPDSQTLSAFATPEEYTLLGNYMRDSVGIPLGSLERFKPMVVQQLLLTFGNNTDLLSYDMHFHIWCSQHQKPVGALETAAQQVAFLDSIPYDKQIDWMLEEIQSGGQSDSLFIQMAKAYHERDLNMLYQFILASDPEFSEFADLLLYDRNERWAEQLDRWMKEESLFIAVGAGHLLGDEGLIQFLRNKGYQITNIY
jgi:uncharacterized protein YbaP (TraB family)